MELVDVQWALVSPLIPPTSLHSLGCPLVDPLATLNGIFSSLSFLPIIRILKYLITSVDKSVVHLFILVQYWMQFYGSFAHAHPGMTSLIVTLLTKQFIGVTVFGDVLASLIRSFARSMMISCIAESSISTNYYRMELSLYCQGATALRYSQL